MKLTRQERAALRASFQEMGPADKAGYIWEYYKLPIALGLLALAFVCSTVYRQATQKGGPGIFGPHQCLRRGYAGVSAQRGLPLR